MRLTEPRTMTDWFLNQLAATPDNVAVTDGARSLSYAELHGAATAVAHELDRNGVPAGSLVGLSVTRGWRAVVGMLAIWMHGCGYVPIDPTYPAQRRSFIASDARIGHILVDGGGQGIDVVSTGNEQLPHQVPADVAYAIYTSGSTGTPKGVVVRQANLVSLLRAATGELPTGQDDAGTAFHSYSFDFSVWEIWRMLATGGRSVMVAPHAMADPAGFAKQLVDDGVTRLNLVPSVFGQFVRALGEHPVPLPQLRELIFGGEPVDLAMIQRWYRLGLAPQAQLVNMYGITETTIHVTVKRLSEDMVANHLGSGTPIGRPLRHLKVVVLDEQRNPLPSGATGEMYVAGSGVSAGYLGHPALTVQRFVRLPHDNGADRWYRTGDYAQLRDDGELVFAGRRDGQIQLRGHRIELGEVEAAVMRLPGVAGSGAAIAQNKQGEPVLIACYIPSGATEVTEAQLRAALRDRLPGYMVPGRLIAVPRLPVTPEGKLDRASLARHVDGGLLPQGGVQGGGGAGQVGST